MQSDPVQFSTFGHMEETVPQESLAKFFYCSKCTLIFKSKVYLFEHLNKVHCLDIDVCLRDAGLKYAESKKVNTEKSRSAGKSFACRNCDFKTCSQDVLTKHETQCGQTESPKLIEVITTPVTTSNQHDEAEAASSSKDLRIYKRPSSQTITKYFTATSGSNVKLKLSCDTKKTFSLEETPQIDVSFRPSDVFKHADHLYHSKRGESVSQAEQTNTVISEVGRNTSNESLKAPASKKPKLEEGATENKTSKPSGSAEFSFEVSDEEEERKAKLVNRDPPRPKVYFCKHCDYSNVSSRLVSSHYASDHPYVRCNAGYIQQSSDQSATFRCLECPVEFLSTVDLKWHYTEKHPEAPDVFKMKLNELKLEFKCFTCTFTCSEVKDLKHHYKQNHRTWEVDNSLLFCQYLVKECQKMCEKTASPEKSVELSPKRTSTPHKEVEITLSRHPPTSTGPDATLYKCVKCQFEHKSAVAMQVHYQKKHPEKLVTLDEIKQLAREMTPEKKSLQKEKSTVQIKEKDTTPEVSKGSPEHLRIESVKSLADYAKKESSPSKHIRKTTDETASSQKVKLKPAPSLQTDSKLSQSELPSKATLKTPEISTPKCVKSSKKESTTKMSLSKPNTETTKSKSDKYLCSSPLDMHYCQFCSYASPQIRSVIGHHNAKHAAHKLLSKEDIIQYSAEVIENKNPITFKTSSHMKNSNECKTQIRKTEVSVHVDQLYFCHLCNLGNPSTQGIIAHQTKVHHYKHSSRKSILKYSALVREKIEKNGSDSSKLPLPIIKEEDKDMFFCHNCNYKHRSLAEVAHHFSRIHCKPFNKTDIRQYTSKVLEQLQKSPLKSAANQEKPEGKKEATNMSSKTFSNSVINTETHRKLPCKYCTFTTQYVFLLMSHMRKIHFSKLSVAAVLRLCFRRGALESGYHCEWCVFSHKKAEVVHKHYQDRHPGCKQMSLAIVKARLFVGIKELHSKDEKTELKSVSIGQTSQSSQKDQDQLYHCTLCTFKSNAKRYLTRHCNKFHPLLVKDSPSDKGKREKSELDDLNEMPGLFESFQVPLEDTDEETSSSDVIKCPSCPATFHSKHGLSVHTGIKHLNGRNVKKQPEQIEGHLHVYKCPYCNYFNTSHQGVLTHCQMRHPVSTSRADSLYLDTARLSNCDDVTKGNSSDEVSKFSGYMCKTCPQICATLNKLKRHREQDHNETTSGVPKPPSSTPKLSLRINLAKPSRTLKSVSKTLLHTKKVYIKIKCPQCPYVCSTNLGLNSHVLKQHNNAAPKDGIHKCMLCSQTYPFKRRLAKHYVRTHGKGAFQKYYIPLYKPFQKKKESSSQQQQNNSEKRLIYKCPTCPYVNTSYHGTLTHCQMKHPSFTVRADELETGEILLSNIVRCSKGKGSYKRGYMCKSCPEIHPSIKKLINHCRTEHGKAAVSELLSEAEKQDDNEDEAEETSVQLQREDGKAAPLKIVLKKDSTYKCELCTYSALTRKNLQCHYKYFHKLDALSTYKKLERYNKRKNNFPFRYIELKKQLNLICKKCPNSVFASSQLLIEHYNNFHHLRSKSDFTVVSFGVRQKSTGLYKCNFCRKNLHGIRYLTRHMDRHRDQMKVEASQKKLSFASGTADPPSPKVSQTKDKVPTVETIAELSHWTGAPVKVVTLPSSPPPSSSKVPDVDPEAEAQEAGHTCKRCQRTFMSLKGLRSHERSHAALGAIKKLDNLTNTEFKNNIKKYLLHKPETLKPYRCGCCAYRTNFMALWQSHFLKNHQDIIEEEITETRIKDEEISPRSDKEVLNNLPELDEEPEDVEESTESYSEPPNVQRQLTHYSLMAQNVDKTNMNLHELSLSEGNLQCEMCNFNTEHLSSIRRHYANRHGKKILRCKDCEFYTGLRKNMEMHVETGHSTCQSKPTYLKDLRCPFCLYQTKNKNNMIDHIVLHREERIMPIEVRRPKLSRYLQDIVFRCHKCTFSSGSAENLRLHMMRHDDVKPYKCRLCYFDCSRLADLEAHLSDKHQVLRNHELVGQVSLDQLEARTGSRPETNVNHGSNSDELEAEEFTPDRDDVPQTDSIPDYHSTENMMLPMKEEHEPEEREKNGKTSANSSGSDIIQQNTSVLQRHEQDTQAQDQNVAFHQPAKEQHEENTEPKAEDCSDADIKYDNCRKNQTTWTDRQDEKVAQRSLTSGKITDAKADGLHFTENHCKSQSIEAMVENDIVRHVLQLDEDGSLHKRAGQERTVKMEQTTEGHGADNELNDKVCSTSLSQNLKIQDIIVNPATTKMNSAQGNASKLREGFRFEPHLLTLSPSRTRLKLSHRGSLGSVLANFKREQSQSPKIIKDKSEPNREKAELKECAKEEPPHLEQCEEKKEDEQMEKTDREVEVNKKNECKVQVSPHLHDDAFAPMDGASELLHDKKLFTCELCGRNLMNVSELNRHILRHGV
ncbi:zinc finger protein 462-like [Xiphophorus couchianus]|uniref:zinc finger protein 462-like n=1 Tax=Xiphophorus couchianus TaxID=32473 RepID=UPI0010171020|nr:zinc finger protein 462-like [Xiphophorus couchianus]XP_027890094.1 zinc finger protein 462-like [Xiphophorus couchianus]